MPVLTPFLSSFRFTFNNRSSNWYCVNFSLREVDPAILDRAMLKNANVTSKNARPVSTLAQEAAKTEAQAFKKIAGDHLRIRFITFYGYDCQLRLVLKEQPESRLFPWVSENIKKQMPNLSTQNVCNPRQAGYARLFSRSYMLHSLVSCLQHGLDVPDDELIRDLRKCLQEGDTTSTQAQTVDLLDNLRYRPQGHNKSIPKPHMERFLTCADLLCKEAVAFVSYFFLGFVLSLAHPPFIRWTMVQSSSDLRHKLTFQPRETAMRLS